MTPEEPEFAPDKPWQPASSLADVSSKFNRRWRAVAESLGMKYNDGGWGIYGIDHAHGREEALQKHAEWQARAAAIPGAEVRVMILPDPLGGEMFYFSTQTLELIPPERHLSPAEIQARVADLKRTASVEDRDAIELLERLLRGEF